MDAGPRDGELRGAVCADDIGDGAVGEEEREDGGVGALVLGAIVFSCGGPRRVQFAGAAHGPGAAEGDEAAVLDVGKLQVG